MEPTPTFRPDLYRDTADYYDRFRVPYPYELIYDLVTRTALSGKGRLLDLGCGPGRVTFPLCPYFAEVVAVDQEEESVSYARHVAAERGGSHVRWRTGRAEDLDLPGGFELVTIGDAFHRLDRRRVATLATGWLRPGGHIALLWTSMPWEGSAAWQKATLAWVTHWMEKTGSLQNIPADLAESVVQAPHVTVLGDAGLELIGTYEFRTPHRWTIEALVGFAHSTSILSRPILGSRLREFETDLRARLLAAEPAGSFEEVVTFTYDLAVRP